MPNETIESTTDLHRAIERRGFVPNPNYRPPSREALQAEKSRLAAIEAKKTDKRDMGL